MLNEPVHMGLDDALEYLADDELMEVSKIFELLAHHCIVIASWMLLIMSLGLNMQ